MGAANVKAANINEGKGNFLYLEGSDGSIIPLRSDLYDNIAPVSDPYDPASEYIGYVDPEVGVVIVNAEPLQEEYDRINEVDGDKQSTSLKTSSSTMTVGTIPPGMINSSPERRLSISTSVSPRANKQQLVKTMHELAYEKMNDGKPLPNDSTRPISGFGIKKGILLYNSSTFNAFTDKYHSATREMNPVEINKLAELVAKLNRESQSRADPN